MAQAIPNLQVYVGRSLDEAKSELEAKGYTVQAIGFAVCFSNNPGEFNAPTGPAIPADPNKPIDITYNVDDPQQRVHSIRQS